MADAGFTGSFQNIRKIIIKLFKVEMRMGICEYQKLLNKKFQILFKLQKIPAHDEFSAGNQSVILFW